MESEVQAYFKNKTVFLTGGSGFLGKVTIEKMLRSTDVKRIYVLIREKRGLEINDRIKGWGSDPLFEVLLKAKPQALQRIMPIAGDCLDPDLGISVADRELLAMEVQIVVHSAATVRFNEPLHRALDINTRATRLIMQLAKEMRNLEVFMYVSTAFSNCVTHQISERFYPEHLNCSADTVLKLRTQLSDELIDNMAPALQDKFPNSYTYTKALAEQIVQTEAGNLPICIFRPGIIIPTFKEPVMGWVDNMFGVIGVLFGAAMGVLRIAPVNGNAHAALVPVDYCANIILASVWETGTKDTKAETEAEVMPIYNFVPHKNNLFSWYQLRQNINDQRSSYPLNGMLWYPFLLFTDWALLYTVLCFIYHWVPAYAIDLVLRLRRLKPRMVDMYKKIDKNVDIVAPFVGISWTFQIRNTERLWKRLSPQDKMLYDFDMEFLNWAKYWQNAVVGIRVFLAHEDPDQKSIDNAQKKLARFKFMHQALHLAIFGGGTALLWSMLKLFIF